MERAWGSIVRNQGQVAVVEPTISVPHDVVHFESGGVMVLLVSVVAAAISARPVLSWSPVCLRGR